MTSFQQNSCYSSICPSGFVNLDQLRFEFQQTNYKDFSKEYHHRNEGKNYLKRKIQSIPCALLALTKAICHVAQLAFYSIKALISKHDKPLKAYGFYVLRDIQEVLGRLISLFHDCSGLYLLEKSRFHKEYYHALLIKGSFVHPQISSLGEGNEIVQNESKDEIHEDKPQPKTLKENPIDQSKQESDLHKTLDIREKSAVFTSKLSPEDEEFFKKLDKDVEWDQFNNAYSKYKKHCRDQASVNEIEFAKRMIERCIMSDSFFIAFLYAANLFELKSEEAQKGVEEGKELIRQLVAKFIKVHTYGDTAEIFRQNHGKSAINYIIAAFAEAYFKENNLDLATKLIADKHYTFEAYCAYYDDPKKPEDFYQNMAGNLLDKGLFIEALIFVEPFYSISPLQGKYLIEEINKKWIDTMSYDEVAKGFKTFEYSNRPEYYRNLAYAYFDKKQFENFIKFIDEFSKDEKKDAIIRVIREYYQTNQCDKAEECFSNYLKLDATNSEAQKKSLISFYIEDDDLSTAYTIVTQIPPQSQKIYLDSIIDEYGLKNEWEKAIPIAFKMKEKEECRTAYLVQLLKTASSQVELENMKNLFQKIVYHYFLLKTSREISSEVDKNLENEAELFIQSNITKFLAALSDVESLGVLVNDIREHVDNKFAVLYPQGV